MAEFEALTKLLAGQLGENPRLRQSLVESVLAILGEEERGEQDTKRQSYLDLLEQVEQNRLLSQKQGKIRISAALNNLEIQLRKELQQVALALHRALRSGQSQAIEEHARHVGIDVQDFPVGFSQATNLLELSEIYLKANRDLHFLHTHFLEPLPDVTGKITAEKNHAGQWLQEVAWDTLSGEASQQIELSVFRKTCLDVFRRRQSEAEHELSAILWETDTLPASELLQKIEIWLLKFGILSRKVLKELSPQHKRIMLESLVRIRDYPGLEALLALDLGPGEQDYFETLMTLRFGEEFRRSIQTWKIWLKQSLDQTTQRGEAIAFWRNYPASIPTLLAEHLEHLDVPKTLQANRLQEIGEIGVAEFLESRRSLMIAAEIRILETTQKVLEERKAEKPAETPVFEIGEIPEMTPEPGIAPESPKEPSLVQPIIEGVVGTAVNYLLTGGSPESAILSAADKSSKGIAQQLTVTIEEEQETQAEQKPTGLHFKIVPDKPVKGEVRKIEKPAPKRSKIQAEPAESIWRDHIFPFVTRNLVFVLAPSFIFIGLLLLEFTLWNKAAWIRYGLTPFLIVSMSYALSRIGLWLKGEDIKSETPIVILQSVAVLLAPMSLLFVALLAGDRELALMVKVGGGILLSAALLAAWSYIFSLAISAVYRAMAGIYSVTLLLLNALLLLVPVAQLTISPGETGFKLTTKAILIAGFYVGFLILWWSMQRVLGKMMKTEGVHTRVPMIFYSITCIGTFALVWGLTHARLMILPHSYTYSPLLLLFSFLIVMVEFKLLEIQQQQGRITVLSYAAYFLIGFGVLLSLGHDYVRVIALLLAGLVWFYQALKLKQTVHPLLTSPIKGEEFPVARHFKIAIMILTMALSGIALIKEFPAQFFPYLALIVVVGLYGLSRAFPVAEVTLFAASLSAIYLSFAFVVSILWQLFKHLPPLHYGIAFVLFGLFAVYLGAQTDKLIHVHAGAGYLAAALPYLGFMNMKLHTLEGNTLVFGLSLIGIGWVVLSSMTRNPALKDSRSTVLWNIGMLAFCILCLRLILKDTLDLSANPFLQFQILSGPLIVGGLMLLLGYLTQSYIPVYLGLFILVIIFPEIKDRFKIPMYSGLGSTASGIGFLTLVLLLSLWQHLYESRQLDLIWRKKTFPFQAKNSYLVFANPLVVAAFFLFTRTIFVTYPLNYFRPLQPFSIRTPLAVLLCGTAYHFFSVWGSKKWFSSLFSYIGFIAIFCGIIHSFYVAPSGFSTDARFLPFFIVFAFIYADIICFVCSKILSDDKATCIIVPFRHMQYLAIWIATLEIYAFYTVYYDGRLHTPFAFAYMIPLLVYLCGIAGWFAWNVKRPGNSWFFFIPAYLLFWQLVVLVATQGRFLPDVLIPSPATFYLSTSLMVLGIVASFFIIEHVVTKEQYRRLSPLLWISFILLMVFSPLVVFAFYISSPGEIAFLQVIPQIIAWALVSFVVGRFLNLGFLWLWGVFLLHLLVLPSITGYTRSYISLHPFTLACIAIFLSSLSVITAKVKWLYEHRYSYPWVQNKWLAPSFLFAAAAHLVVVFVFLQAIGVNYRHAWMTIIALFLAAFPALFAAHQIGFSRRFLFGVPYTLACVALVFALRQHFPDFTWFRYLQTPDLIGCALFGALLTAVISEYVLRAMNRSLQTDRAYRGLKYLVAIGILTSIAFAYLSTIRFETIGWQWLLTSGVLALGAGLYFRYFEEDSRQTHEE